MIQTGFSGMAMINSVDTHFPVSVRFEETAEARPPRNASSGAALGALTLHGITIDQARTIISVLESVPAMPLQEPVAATAAPTAPTPVAPLAASVLLAPASAPAPRLSRPAPTVDEGRLATIAAANPAKAPKEAKEPASPRRKKADAEAPVEAAPVAVEAPPPPAPPAPKSGPAVAAPQDDGEEPVQEGAGDVPEELVAAKSVRAVLEHLMESGITDVEELKSECRRIQAHVPVLARIEDLNGRIDRTVAVMDMGAEVT